MKKLCALVLFFLCVLMVVAGCVFPSQEPQVIERVVYVYQTPTPTSTYPSLTDFLDNPDKYGVVQSSEGQTVKQSDGMTIIQGSDGQTIKYPDGMTIIQSSDGQTIKYPNGKVIVQDSQGQRIYYEK